MHSIECSKDNAKYAGSWKAKEDCAEHQEKPLRLTDRRRNEGGGAKAEELGLKETLVHCAAVEQLLLLLLLLLVLKWRHPLLAALDRGTDPFNVCVDLIYDRLGPATVQGSSPFQINVSDHRQWVD